MSWTEFDENIWIKIFQYLSVADVGNINLINKYFNGLGQSDHLWGLKLKQRFGQDIYNEILNHKNIQPLNSYYKELFRFKNTSVEEIIIQGKLYLLKYSLTSICSTFNLTNWTYLAAFNGHIHILKWVLSRNNKNKIIFKNNIEILASCGAARGGHLYILKWLYKLVDFDSEVANYAAKGGHIHILNWLKHKNIIPTPDGFMEACIYSKYQVIDWAEKENLICTGEIHIYRWMLDPSNILI